MNQLNYEQLQELAGQGAHIHVTISLDNGDQTPPDDDGPGSQDPATLLIQMLQREAFKQPSSYNKKGKPIMEKTVPGFRAEVGDIFQVYVVPIVADGGGKYWRIWK